MRVRLRTENYARKTSKKGLRAALAIKNSGSHFLGALFHSANNILVARAAADIALEQVTYFTLGGLGMLTTEVDRTHHHPRRAETALQPVTVFEGLLHGMQGSVVCSQTLDGVNLRALGLHQKNVARLHGVAVH